MKHWRIAGLALAAALGLTGCGAIPGMGGGDQEGAVGETMSNAWFDFTVDSAQAVDSYEGYTAGEGEKLVVVDVTMRNTFTQSVPMSSYDFQLFWEDISDDDDRCFALPSYCQAQLPDSYELAVDEERAGALVYEVPREETDFQFMFLEIIDDGSEEGSTGDLFTVSFTTE